MPGRRMRRGTRVVASIAATLASTVAHGQAVNGWTDAQRLKRAAQFAALSPETVAAGVTIDSDDLEPTAKLTTEPTYKFKGGFTDRVRADNLLRAFISRTTGKTTFQLYQTLDYTGDGRGFIAVNYATPDGPVTADLTIRSSDVTCPYGVCVHHDSLAFEISETLLRELGARLLPPNRGAFASSRAKARTGPTTSRPPRLPECFLRSTVIAKLTPPQATRSLRQSFPSAQPKQRAVRPR